MDFQVYANYGSFSDISSAANSEKIINWWDYRDERQTYCTECFAAMELIEHLKLAGFKYIRDRSDNSVEVSSGDRSYIDLKIFVGKQIIEYKWPEIPLAGRDGAYKSFFVNNAWNVWVWGENCFGTLRAAYAWLQTLGVRWFSPDEHGTYIPANPELHEAEQILNYDFLTRGCYNEFIDDSNPGLLDWSARNGMNMLRVQHFSNPHSVKKRGLQIMSGGHDIFYKYMNPNSVYPYNIIEDSGRKSTYYEIHPEWFALIDGARSSRDENKRATEGYYTGDNICTSNIDGIGELAKNMLVSLNKGDYRYCDYLNLWAYDNGTWCSCKNCIKLGNLSRRMLMLAYEINKIFKTAYEKGKTHRRIKLIVPVYHETLEPPDLQLPDDFDYEYIITTFFPIERCYAHNIDDESCTETNLRLKKIYEKWTDPSKGNYKGDIFIGEYYNVSSFASLPLVFTGTMMNDIPYYYKTGTRHLYYMHIPARNWGMLLLNNCILTGFLKLHNFNAEEFFRNFYSVYYPLTGRKMQEFHNTLERASANMKYLKHYQFIENGEKVSLIGEIVKKERFPTKHCKFDHMTDDPNNAISFVGTMQELLLAEQQINNAMKIAIGIEKQRIQTEKMRFDYGYKVMKFIFNYVQLRNAVEKNETELIAEIFLKTELIRKELILITTPLEEMKYECPWYENAYKATWHDKTYDELRMKLLR